LPTTVVNFFYTSQVPDWLAAQFGHGRPLFVVYNVVLIIFLSLLYVAFVLDPANVAEKLKRYGGIIPGVEPGEATAAHIDRVVSRTSILGAAYLALVAVTPEILIAYAPVTFYFSATSLFLVVGVVLDIRARVRADMRLNSPGSAGR
jgi:preprotein translocase subunit SecY